MYIPKTNLVTDTAVLHSFMQANNFAILVSQNINGELVATHLPLILHPERGTYGMLVGHFARANDHWKALDPASELLVIFQGAHTYISASWYEQMPSVPTWNYATVHAYGRPNLIDDPAQLRPMLAELVDHHEASFPSPWSTEILEDYEGYMDKMMKGIVGFEITITRLEGKFKMSQNRSETDRQRVITALAASDYPPDQQVAAMMHELETADSPRGA